MALRGLSAEQAFSELAVASQRYNIKVAALARGLVALAAGETVSDAYVLSAITQEWGVEVSRLGMGRSDPQATGG